MSNGILARGAAVALAPLVAFALVAPLLAQQSVDLDILAKIREEANSRSQILRTIHVLSDVYGPRLTGTPNLKAAGEWSTKTMESWGLVDGHLEAWDFGQPGWANERFSAHLVSPVKDTLVGEVVAWTPGTNGRIVAQAFQLEVPDDPTTEELTAYLASVKADVRGKIVLANKSVPAPVDLNPLVSRRDDTAVRRQFDPDEEPAPPPARTGHRRQGLTPRAISRRVDEFLVDSGARLRLNDARLTHGQVVAFGSPTDEAAAGVPSVVLRNEDYGRIARILADGTRVDLEFDIVNRFYPDGRTAYNAVADIAGSDKADEIVLLGAHLDSWQSATGATDNAVGCAVMMEAARILLAIGVQPRRTIRVALWSGEEQGLRGSRAYVKQHFGSFEDQEAAFFALAAYLNFDHGTGRPRGATVFGPPQAATVFREALAPLADLGFVGVVATRRRALGTTDHTSFNRAGLPGIDFYQDPIEYDSHTHHTNLDTYERILEEDVKASAIVVATAAYELAMREELLPRFSRAQMPAGRR